MHLDDMEKLIDALVLADTGWTGAANGPMHQAHIQARRVVEERRNEILRRAGVCPHCGAK
jgi:hypothetical protein